MKNLTLKLSAALFMLLSTALVFGQFTAGVSGTLQDLNSVHMVTESVVVATGNNGAILRSTDGGATYAQVFTAIDDVSEVQFVDANTGYAVSDNGRFLKTVNGGLAWSLTSIGTASNLSGLHFRDAANGHVVGRDGIVFATADGGTTWSAQASGSSERLESVYFSSALVGYIVGRNDTYITTTNGGATWSVSGILGTGRDLNDITFVDANNGHIASDNGVVLRTANAGATWTSSIAGTAQNLNEVHFIDALNGLLAGDGGVVRSTTDGGATWAVQASSTVANLEDIHATSVNNGAAVGNAGSAIFRSIAPCTAPVSGLNVTISVATNSVNFSWNAYPDAQSYLIEGGALGGALGAASTLTNGLSLPGNSNFSYGTSYIWRVTPTCTDGSVGPASAFDTFTTPTGRIGQEELNVSVSPNPASDYLNIRLAQNNEGAFVRVLSLAGEQLSDSRYITNGESIEVSTLAAGIYLLEVSNEATVSHEKFIIR